MQGLEGKPEARRRTRRQVLHQHVGLLQQAGEHVGSLGMLDVQRQAFLGTVGPHEMRGQALDPFVIAAGEIAGPGTLDLDHAGAEIGQLARAEGRGDGVFQ